MKHTINDISSKHCTGCASCKNICPTNAIKMLENEEGFLFPTIENDRCVECGECYKKCPVNSFEKFAEGTPDVYAVMGRDEYRATSSSGGVFAHLAEYVFKKGGITFGVANKTPFELEFVSAESMEELEKLKAAKCFQAVVGSTYKTIKKELKKGRMVLFGACPCQVAALKSFLGADYDNLITVDVVCNGVPSYKAVKKYTEGFCEATDVKALLFRDKTKYGWSTTNTIEKNNGEVIRQSYEDSLFYRAYGAGLMARESCYNCKFARTERVGDFTLADYWHISEFNSEMNDGKGTSCVFVNTDLARRVFNEICCDFKKYSIMPFETAVQYNTQIKQPEQRHPQRTQFYKNLKERPFDGLVNESMDRKHFDVGVVGYWYATNYGSVITYYSLYKAIEDMGYKTVIIDRPDKYSDAEPQTVFSRTFMNKFANISDSYRADEMGKFDELCDKFVIGSDQVWTLHAARMLGYRFFLDFVSDSKTKVAYACSFGQDYFGGLPETRKNISYLLSRFDGVSVRENTGIDVCKNEFNIDAVQMIDPIFLNKREFYDEIAEHSNLKLDEPYVLSYILDPDENKRNMLLHTEKKMKMKMLNILDGRYNTFDRNNQRLNLKNTLKDVDEEQWVKLFAKAEYVITDSHHGFAMAVLFNKPVICIMNKERGGSRFTSLLGWLGMLDRLVDKTENLADKDYLFEPYDYTKVNEVIEEKRIESLEWLKNSLAKEKSTDATLYDFFNGRIRELQKQMARLQNENAKLNARLEEMEGKH